MDKAVGPVLRMGDEVEAVIRAIEEDNPDKPLEVIDRGVYIRVQAPEVLRVSRASLERHLGHDFEMRQLETMLSAFAGRITVTSEEMRWEYGKELG
jgi:toluene monooxygenase system protein D